MRHTDIANKTLITPNFVDASLGIIGIAKSINQIGNKGKVCNKDLTDLFNEIPHEIEAVCKSMLEEDTGGKLVRSVGEMKRFLKVTIEALKAIDATGEDTPEAKLKNSIMQLDERFQGAALKETTSAEVFKGQIEELQRTLKQYVAVQGLELAKKYAVKKGEEVHKDLETVSAVAKGKAESIDSAVKTIEAAHTVTHELSTFIQEVIEQEVKLHNLTPKLAAEINSKLKNNVNAFNVTIQGVKELYATSLKYTMQYIEEKAKERTRLEQAKQEAANQEKRLIAQVESLKQDGSTIEQKLMELRQKLYLAESKQESTQPLEASLSEIETNLKLKQTEIANTLEEANQHKKEKKKTEALLLVIDTQIEAANTHQTELRGKVNLPNDISLEHSIIMDDSKALDVVQARGIAVATQQLQQAMDIIVKHGVVAKFANETIREEQQLFDKIFVDSNLFTGITRTNGKKEKQYTRDVIEPFLTQVNLSEQDRTYIKQEDYHNNQFNLRAAMLEVASGRIQAEVDKKLKDANLNEEHRRQVDLGVANSISELMLQVKHTRVEQLKDAKDKLKKYTEKLITAMNVTEALLLKQELHEAISALDDDGRKHLNDWVLSTDPDAKQLHDTINYVLSFDQNKKFADQAIVTSQQAIKFVGDLESDYKARLQYIEKRATDLSTPINSAVRAATQEELTTKDMQKLMAQLSNDLAHNIDELTKEILPTINTAKVHNCTGISSFF